MPAFLGGGLVPCGTCGAVTVTGWCTEACRLAGLAEATAEALDIDPPVHRWRLIGRDGMTFPDRELTQAEAQAWLTAKRGAYPVAELVLMLIDEGQ